MRSRAMRTLVVVLTAVIKLMAQAKSPTSEGDYVGSDVCITCHADQGKHFQSTVMGKAFAHAKNDREKLGCEACHGPGRVHVTSGGGKDTIPIRFTKGSMNTVEERNDACYLAIAAATDFSGKVARTSPGTWRVWIVTWVMSHRAEGNPRMPGSTRH